MKNKSFVIPIPRSIPDLTAEWFESVLQDRFPGIKIENARIETLPGFKPNKVRAYLDYPGGKVDAGFPKTVVVKGGFARHITSDYEQDLTRPLDLGMQMEARAYKELVPTLDVTTPDCFYADVCYEGGDGIVVMEDLSPKGGTFFTAFKPMTYNQAIAFVDAHAAVNARWWNSTEFEPGGRFGPESEFGQCGLRIHNEYLAEFKKPEIWNRLILNPHNTGLPQRFLDRDTMVEAFSRLSRLNDSVARTIIHGDEHLKNFYVLPDGSAGFADWCSRIEPWANGYAYFIGACIDSLDRRVWERALLARYLDSLCKHGVDAPPFEEAWLAYRRAMIFPLYCWIINNSSLQPPNVNCAYTARTAMAAIDLQSLEAVGM